jgi:hypothetical protein
VDAKHLVGHWRHSHEEDQGDQVVFRPVDYKFPPSRGRVAFRLDDDGGARRFPIGADDRSGAVVGTWRVADDHIEITDQGARAPAQVWQIVSASPKKLVLKRG